MFRPISPKTSTRSASPANSIAGEGTIPTSTPITACLAPTRCSATQFTCRNARMDAMSEAGGIAVQCPTSNLFLGSGPLPAAQDDKPRETGPHSGRHRHRRWLVLFHVAHHGRSLQDPAIASRAAEPARKLLVDDTRGNAEALSWQNHIGGIAPAWTPTSW